MVRKEKKVNRRETGGLMKEAGALLSEQGWPDGWRSEGHKREERRKRRRPAKSLES